MARYFEDGEFACKHCGDLPEAGMDQRLMEVLDRLREKIGEPLTVSSGYRCQTHNRRVGGAPNSYHTRGMAADVYINSDNFSVHQIKQMALESGADTAVAYPSEGFVHIDMRGYSADWE